MAVGMGTSNTIAGMKLLIADDHALTREGLRLLLRQLDDDVRVHEAASYDELSALLTEHPDADLAIVDLHMPDPEGKGSLAALRSQHPTAPVVVLSGSEDAQDMRRALGVGAMGFLPKSAPPAVLLNALRLVLSGGIYVPPALLAQGVATPADAAGSAVTLTPRQRGVLEQLVLGRSNKEIARTLGMSEATVKVHLGAIFRALNVTSRTQAVLAARQHRLFEEPGSQA